MVMTALSMMTNAMWYGTSADVIPDPIFSLGVLKFDKKDVRTTDDGLIFKYQAFN